MKSVSKEFLLCLMVSLLLASTTTLGAADGLRGDDSFDDFDCDAGCSLDPSEMGAPVCGVDNVTYFNKCLAICQGIQVAKNGPCDGDISFNNEERDLVVSVGHHDDDASTSSYEREGKVHAEILSRYQSENLKFVGKRKFQRYNIVDLEQRDPPKLGTKQKKQKRGTRKGDGKLLLRAHRITPEGYEYIANIETASDSTDSMDELPPFNNEVMEYNGQLLEESNSDSNNHHNIDAQVERDLLDDDDNEMNDDGGDGDRHLVTVGKDTRKRVPTRKVKRFPFRLVGELDLGGRLAGGCSGTVIGKNTVLTAGHCLYWYGEWNDHTYFAPGRTRSPNGKIYEPYGDFVWEEINYFAAYREYPIREFDIAVIKYLPNSNGQSVGDLVGYAGLRRVPNGGSSFLQKCQIRGYPEDKTRGEMWTSGKCKQGFFPTDNDKITAYFCDTSPGMSGSGLMDKNGFVHGVHAFGMPNYNGGILLSGENFEQVKAWAERSENQTPS